MDALRPRPGEGGLCGVGRILFWGIGGFLLFLRWIIFVKVICVCICAYAFVYVCDLCM